MTNEEAIKIFKEVREEVIAKETELSRQVFENLGIKAIDLAIKALEQQPCEDCISRAEALKAIEKEKQGWEGAERYAIDECHTRIADLPSVTPKGVTITDFADKCRECGKLKEVLVCK